MNKERDLRIFFNPNKYSMALGEAMRLLRTSENLSTDEIALILELDKYTYIKVESGQVLISKEHLAHLSSNANLSLRINFKFLNALIGIVNVMADVSEEDHTSFLQKIIEKAELEKTILSEELSTLTTLLRLSDEIECQKDNGRMLYIYITKTLYSTIRYPIFKRPRIFSELAWRYGTQCEKGFSL